MIKFAIIRDNCVFSGFDTLGQPKWYDLVASIPWMMYNNLSEVEKAIGTLSGNCRIKEITIDNIVEDKL